MRFLGAVCLFLSCAIALPAAAGPWARGEGEVFVSVVPEWSVDSAGRRDSSVSTFAEYGLGGRLTVGLDLYTSRGGSAGFVFLRRTMTGPARTWQAAITGGIGHRRTSGGSAGLLVAGLSAGRSFETPLGWGWADLALQGRYFDGSTALKLDTTVGITPRENWRVFGQLQLSDYPGAPGAARLQISSVHRLSERLSVELGATHGLIEDNRSGFRLGLWSEF